MGLRRLDRDPARLEALDLFRRLAGSPSEVSISSPQKIDDFLDKIRAGVSTALSKEHTVHGWRTQSLFASIVVALDNCSLIMSTDHGDIYHDGEPFKAADYLVVLDDGSRLAIDVKNIAPFRTMKATSISAKEHAGLTRFGKLVGAEPYIATRYSGPNIWALNRVADFERSPKGRMILDAGEAFKRSEMARLGDVMIGIRPEIRLEILADQDRTQRISADSFRITIGNVKISAGGQVLHEKRAQRIAWFFMFYGGWEEDTDANLQGDKLISWSFIFRPLERSSSSFEIIGQLSTMYSRMFDLQTTGDSGITALGIEPEPGMFESLLPRDYKSEELPMRRASARRSTLSRSGLGRSR